MQQEIFEFPVVPRYSFSNFVVCGGNRAAYHFTNQLAANSDTDNLLYIYGAEGSGKTHLLLALGNTIYQDAESRRICYLSFKNIDELYGGNYPAEAISKLSKWFDGAPALLVDDIHLIPDNPNIRIEFWQLFNDFYTAGKKIAITGLTPPKELPHLDEHLVSRLLWGLVAKLDISDDDSRRLIMQKLAADRQIKLPEEVMDFLLLHSRRDIPSLLGKFESISRYALSVKRKITVRLAKEALGM